MLEEWCKDPVKSNPYILKMDAAGGYQTVSTIYDFSAVLSTSYVSDGFITDYQKLIPNLFDSVMKILFLPPSLWTQLAAAGELARFKKNLNLDYYDLIFCNIHMPCMEHWATAAAWHKPDEGRVFTNSS